MKVISQARTDIGRKRQRNEDAFLEDSAHGLYAVADGLGGLSGGDRASRLAISILKAHLNDSLTRQKPIHLLKVFTDAHQAIQKLGAELDPLLGAGTTLTAVRLHGETLEIAHAGDSAAYLFNADGWQRLTTDHTKAEDLRRESPGQPVPATFEHTLTRCLGQAGELEPDFFTHPIHAGDRLVLCTDGATRHVQPEEIHSWLQTSPTPRHLVDRVIRLANRRGGSDNVTAVAIYID